MATLFYSPIAQVLDNNGNPIPGAKLLAYESGTTTPRDVFSDAALSSAISQPAVADSAGRLPDIYLSANDYKFVLTDASGATIWTQDNYTPPASGSTNLLNGIATATAARAAISAASAADVSANTTTLAAISTQLTGIGGTLGDMAAEDDVAVANLATGYGEVCLARYRYNNSGTGSLSAITADGSIPQRTEGGEVWSEDITPKSATSKLVIRGIVNLDSGGSVICCAAVFVDGASSASRAFAVQDQPAATCIPFEYEFEPGSTDAVEIMVRAGRDGGSSTLNAQSEYGAASVSTMTIEEWETV